MRCGSLVLASCGSSMSYEDYDLNEYLKVGEYKGLTVAPYSISVTDDEVQDTDPEQSGGCSNG